MRARILGKVIGLSLFVLFLTIFTSASVLADPPTISGTWDLQDNMSTKGLYQVRAKIEDDGGPGNVSAYLKASIGGGPFEGTEMHYNEYEDTWGWYGFIEPAYELQPGTTVEYFIFAIDSDEESTQGLYYGFNVQDPPAWKIKKKIESKCQFKYEQKYWGQVSNSWCAPTATAACLRWLQVPGLPRTQNKLVKRLAKKMDTDCISSQPGGCKGAGTACGAEVKGIHKYLNSLGQRGNYTIEVWDDTKEPGYGKADKRHNRNPGFRDYKRELRKCEDVLLIIRYLIDDYELPCEHPIEDGGHIVTGMGWDKAGTSTSAVMDPLCGIRKQPVNWVDIIAGPNCHVDTVATGDDVQLVPWCQMVLNPLMPVIGPGPNGCLDTKPKGDDVCRIMFNGKWCVAGAMISISPIPAP